MGSSSRKVSMESWSAFADMHKRKGEGKRRKFDQIYSSLSIICILREKKKKVAVVETSSKKSTWLVI